MPSLKPHIERSSMNIKNLIGLFKNKKLIENNGSKLDKLFHPLNKSPIPALRSLSDRISVKGKCPISGKSPLNFICPISGYPTHYSEKEWELDEDYKKIYSQRLREVNEDEHDLRSGRNMTEFELPGKQDLEQTVSLKTWEMLFYTRNFNSIDNMRSQRHLSRLLSYPMTIAGVLHELGPYADKARGRVPLQGERSLLALRYNLHKQPLPYDLPTPPIRIFIPGARAESQLPAQVWMQLAHLFPYARFQIYFVGPEVNVQNDEILKPIGLNGWSKIYDPQLSLYGIKATWEQIHDYFLPYDPFTDIFFNFHPGLGFPSNLKSVNNFDKPNSIISANEVVTQIDAEWCLGMSKMLSTKCPIILSAFSPSDLKRDVDALLNTKNSDVLSQEWETVIEPGDNVFSSQRWEVAEFVSTSFLKKIFSLIKTIVGYASYD